MAEAGTLVANGNTDEYTVSGNDGVWVHISGDIDGGTWTIQFSSKESTPTWKTLAGSSLTVINEAIHDLPHGTKIRGNLAGALESPSALYWQFASVRKRA
jgi:hypothetical protein